MKGEAAVRWRVSVIPEIAEEKRYSFIRIVAAAMVLTMAAPVFWLQTTLWGPGPQGDRTDNTLIAETAPALAYGFERVARRELPLWNPYQLAGLPHLADPAHGVFQPLNLVFALMPVERAMAVHSFIALFLMGLGCVLWFRSLGVNYTPSLLGATLYAFCGTSAAAVSHPELANALAWTPFLLWSLQELLQRYTISASLVAGMFTAMWWLSGSIVLNLAMGILVIPYVIAGAVWPRQPAAAGPRKRALTIALVPLIAFTIGAAQFLPAAQWLLTLESPLDALLALPAGATTPLTPWDALVQALAAHSDGVTPRAMYLGIVPLIVAPVALLHDRRRREAVFAWLFIAALLIVALGMPASWKSSPVVPALLYPLPLAAALLAALGADRLLMPRHRHRILLVVGPGLVSLAAAAGIVYVSTTQGRGTAIVAAALLLPWLVFRARWIGIGVCAAMIMLLYVDLTAAGGSSLAHPYRSGHNGEAGYAEAMGAVSRYAGHDRVLVLTPEDNAKLPVNLGMMHGVRVAGGFGQALTREQAAWWRRLSDSDAIDGADASTLTTDPATLRLLNYMGTRAAIASAQHPLTSTLLERADLGWRAAELIRDFRLLANDDALPRAYWVPSAQLADGAGEAAVVLSSKTFDANRQCVIERGGGTGNAGGKQNLDSITRASASCEFIEDTPEHVALRVSAPASGFVVLADSYASGWYAAVDGNRVPILRANGLFRAVPIAQGEHVVTFTYRPLAFWVGFGISTGFLGVSALAGLIILIRRV